MKSKEECDITWKLCEMQISGSMNGFIETQPRPFAMYYGCVCATVAELSSSERGLKACKA